MAGDARGNDLHVEGTERAPRGRVEYPSSRFRSYTALGVARLSVPDNWREMSQQDSVWYAPSGGYGSANGQAVFTHGINIGVAAPMAYFPFTGWKDSFFGDMHGQGRDAIEFYTDKKVVIERWVDQHARKF